MTQRETLLNEREKLVTEVLSLGMREAELNQEVTELEVKLNGLRNLWGIAQGAYNGSLDRLKSFNRIHYAKLVNPSL